MKISDRVLDAFTEFVVDSPSSYHAAREVGERLLEAELHEFSGDEEWSDDDIERGFVVRDGAIVAWRFGSSASASSPLRIVGSHTDSPGFRIKPNPDRSVEGWAQIGVEVYGGPLLNSWLDRDLA